MLKINFCALGDEDILAAMQQLSARAPECIQVSSVQSRDAAPVRAPSQIEQELCCKTFNGRISMPWRITSFSGFISGRVHEAEVQERDSDEHVIDPALVTAPPGANEPAAGREYRNHAACNS